MNLFRSALVIFLLSDVSGGSINNLEESVHSVRVERGTPVCEGIRKFKACQKRSTDEAETNTRPDLVQRKFCNLITSVVEDCGRYLNDCYAAESVRNDLDDIVEAYLENAEENLDGWDSDLCPVVRDFIARKRPSHSPVVVRANLQQQNEMASHGEIAAVEVYTTNLPCMAKDVQYKGMILVSKNKSRNMLSENGLGFKSSAKGEIKLISDLRDELIWELKEKAVQAGANAIVGLRMETNTIFGSVLDMVVYGTAVYFQK